MKEAILIASRHVDSLATLQHLLAMFRFAATPPRELRFASPIDSTRVALCDSIGLPMRQESDSTTQFLNVDLEIESSEDLQPIVDEFGEDVSVLFHGKLDRGTWLACFEIMTVLPSARDPDGYIGGFCWLVEQLTPEARRLWDNCHSRKFDIGIQGGSSPAGYQTQIRPDSVSRLAKLGGTVVITIYSPELPRISPESR